LLVAGGAGPLGYRCSAGPHSAPTLRRRTGAPGRWPPGRLATGHGAGLAGQLKSNSAGKAGQGTDPDRLMLAIVDMLRCYYSVGAWLTGTGL